MLFHAARAQAQLGGDLLGRPSLEMAQREDFSLARRKFTKAPPHQLVGLAPRNLFLSAVMDVFGAPEFVEFLGAGPPSLPPRRPAPIAAGVDRHGGEPLVPDVGALSAAVRAERLEKYLLRGFLGFFRIGKQQPA